MNYEELYGQLQPLEKKMKDAVSALQKLSRAIAQDTEKGDLESLSKDLSLFSQIFQFPALHRSKRKKIHDDLKNIFRFITYHLLKQFWDTITIYENGLYCKLNIFYFLYHFQIQPSIPNRSLL